MRRNMLTRLLCSLAVMGLGVTVVPIPMQAASELEQHLRDQYKGKTLLLRNFYAGNSLQYDASGQLSRSAASGDWTVDAVVRIDDVKVSSHRLTIQAKRLHMGWLRDGGFSPVPDPAGKAGKDYEDAKKLRIEADLSPSEVTADNAEALLARIFFTPQDRFGELVPDYWKPCVRAGLTGKDSKKYSGCHFSAEFLAIPGVAYPPQQKSEPAEATSPSAAEGVFQVGKGKSPPKPIHAPDPQFSEEARQAKFQGTITLMLVVDKTGGVRNIRIVSPMGCGLDGKAVETVEKWQFNPGTKDGEPVDVEIAVEMDFHLY
jgi:TonB family protein